MAPTFTSALTLSATCYISKAFTSLFCRDFKVEGLPILLEALKEPTLRTSLKGKEKAVEDEESVTAMENAPARRGVITICNHNSVMDEPLMWSLMPLTTYLPFASPTHTARNTRWTLGASDILFTKPWHARFFNLGQVLETYRGSGIFQPAVDEAIRLLQAGEWIHIFPEGKVNQAKMNPEGGLLRFKWGIGRIIMDSKIMPEIIPMWISGFDQVMNEDRSAPRFVPRPGARLSVTIGESLTSRIRPLVEEWRDIVEKEEAMGVEGDWIGEKGLMAPGVERGEVDATAQSARIGTSTVAREAGEVWTPAGVDTSEVGRVGGERRPGSSHRRTMHSLGSIAEGRERELRVRICEILQEGVRELGERVERAEGRMDRGEWCQSTRRIASGTDAGGAGGLGGGPRKAPHGGSNVASKAQYEPETATGTGKETGI